MQTRTLPRRDVALTELCFGAAPIGNLFREISDEDAHDTVTAAWDAGIRYFDTAPHYGLGLSERRLGAALAGRPRDSFVVSTKVGRLLVDDPDGAERRDDQGFVVPATSRRVWDFSGDGVRRSLESSLERLGLDRVDIAYVHDPDDHGDEAVQQAFPALAQLRDEGLVRAIGAGMNQTGMLVRFLREVDLDVVMVAGRYTLLDRSAEEELLPLAAERGVAVVVAAPFNSGVLATPDPAANPVYDYGEAPPEVLERATGFADTCARYGCALPDAAIQFPLGHPAVASVAAGMQTADQVRRNARSYAADVPPQVWQELAASRV